MFLEDQLREFSRELSLGNADVKSSALVGQKPSFAIAVSLLPHTLCQASVPPL